MSKVAVTMGSKSDMPVMQDAIDILKGFDLEVEVDIVSAHRTPEKLFAFSQNAHTRGIKVIVAGAGMAIGNSWWYPGTYSRGDSVIRGAKRAMKLLIGIIPVIVIAAIIESYLTYKYQEMGSMWRLFVIVLSFAYIAYYFIILPIQVEKRLKTEST